VEVDGDRFQVFKTDLAERCTAHANWTQAEQKEKLCKFKRL
jgi:hypothetical protein